MNVFVSHRAVRLYVRSLQSNGDAVEEDKNQNHMVEQFVRDHTLAPHTESKHTHISTESSIKCPWSVTAIDQTISH